MRASQRLRFDAGEHRYYLDDKIVPSVTQVLQDNVIIDYRFIDQEVLRAAAEFGTAVHRATELYDSQDLDLDSLDPALAPYLATWIRFREHFGFRALFIEHRVYSQRYRFAGTLDRVGYVEHGPLAGKRVLVDIKTGILLPGFALQTAAYAGAWNEMYPKSPVTHRLCVQIGEDAYKVNQHADRADWNTFLAALTMTYYRGLSHDKAERGVCASARDRRLGGKPGVAGEQGRIHPSHRY